MIPKKIHYFWFGKKTKPKIVRECIASWKTHLPDYEIIEWNESNIEYIDCYYARHTLTNKHWAFLTDYLRLRYLYEYGGIYMDTDMLVLKNFDALLHNTIFLGKQTKAVINGAIIGSVKQCPVLNVFIDYYQNLSKFEEEPIPLIITKLIKKNNVDTIKVYDIDYFYPYSYFDSYKYNTKPLDYATSQTYAVHLWHKSWKHDFFKYVEYDNYVGALRAVVKNLQADPSLNIYWRRLPGTLKKAVKQYFTE